jgi:hypothetical protein
MSQAISYMNRIVCFCRISLLFTFRYTIYIYIPWITGYRRVCDRMVVGFRTTYAISAYHH